MFRPYDILAKLDPTGRRRSTTTLPIRRNSLHLEELEDRNLPAPMPVSPVALPVSLAVPVQALSSTPSSTVSAAQTVVSSTVVASVFVALPGATGTASSQGQVTGAAMSLNGATQATFSPPALPSVNLSAPVGAPDPVRAFPVPPETPGAGASLPVVPRYVLDDTNITGGGGTTPSDQPWPAQYTGGEEGQTDVQSSAGSTDHGEAVADTVFRDAVFQMTVL